MENSRKEEETKQPVIIKANKTGALIIQNLCDVALKAGGVQNLKIINAVLGCVEIIPEEPQVIQDENKIEETKE